MIPATYRRALGGHGGGVFYLHGEDDFRKREAARAIAEAHLDPESIFAGIQRFADEREQRLGNQRDLLAALG